MIRKDWIKAQKAEKEFWENWNRTEKWRKTFWQLWLENFSQEFLKSMIKN